MLVLSAFGLYSSPLKLTLTNLTASDGKIKQIQIMSASKTIQNKSSHLISIPSFKIL